MLSYSEIADLSVPIPEAFRGFDPYGEVVISERNLPHWRQEGATYFVTFRLIDSIPKRVWAELKEEADWWENRFEEAGEKRGELLRRYVEFQKRYQTRIETTLDECAGSCPLRKPGNRLWIERAMLHFDGMRYDLFCYVVMPNHCHVVVRPAPEYALENILASWKKFSSRRITENAGNFWQKESYDRIIRDEEHYRNSVRYLLKNPVKGNLREGESACYVKGLFEERRTTLQSRLSEEKGDLI